jgi:hypothetical protein
MDPEAGRGDGNGRGGRAALKKQGEKPKAAAHLRASASQRSESASGGGE